MVAEIKTYEFNLPTKIISGLGSINRLPEIVSSFGDNVLLITGRNSARQTGLLDKLTALLSSTPELRMTLFDQVEPEPACSMVNAAIAVAREKGCDVIIGVGGGSVLDVAKAAAVLANKKGTIDEYMTGKEISFPGIPCICVPTSAGTGSEVTPNAVLIDPRRIVKESLRHHYMYPRVAVIDAELTITLSAKMTAYSGMDALCQAIESYVSRGSNTLTDAIALQSIQLIAQSIRDAYRIGSNVKARQNMLHGALLSGIALANAKMGAVHGIAHPLGLHYHLPHGLVCGILLPAVMEYNINPVAGKYAQVAALLGNLIRALDKEKAAWIAVDKTKQLLADLAFPWRLRDLGVKQEDFAHIAKASMSSGSLKANPRTVTEEDVITILKKAY